MPIHSQQRGFSRNERKPKKKLNIHKKAKHIKRGKGVKQVSLTIFSNNAAGLTSASKKLCLKSEISFTNAAIFTIQETCFKKKGKFQLKGFEIFEAIRKKEKGGIMIGVHETLKPILIAEYDDECEVLIV